MSVLSETSCLAAGWMKMGGTGLPLRECEVREGEPWVRIALTHCCASDLRVHYGVPLLA